MGLFDWLTGGKKKDTNYYGMKPVASLAEVKGGPETYDELYNRLVKRQGLGFGDSYASKYASPIVQNMRSQFTDYQMPELTAELTKTGRRKGSGGFDQIRRAYQEQGLQEGDVFSRLQQRNEDQIRAELNAALEGMGNYARTNADLQGRRAAFDYGDFNRQLGETQQRQKEKDEGILRALAGGASIALAPVTGGASLVAMPSIMSGSQATDQPSYFNWGSPDTNDLNSRLYKRMGNIKNYYSY